MILTLLLTEEEFELLQLEAGRTSHVEEDLIEDLIHSYIQTLPGYLPDQEETPERRALFEKAMKQSLKENAELYRRLAQS